ncbi:MULTISPECIES: ComEC/Rec2 family competence protein [unclassified Gordonia (in: high G+C Gram-positive bacteria)]|uniref:ComEC/Rec2 family competence protein n=1 Tax=Gordonia sp. B7-2 TaxID=3420932 RepID=UPI003D8A4EC5
MDLRLLLPAVVVWATTIAGLAASQQVTALAAIVSVICCGSSGVACARGLVSWRTVGLLVVATGLAATCATAMFIRQEERADHPLADVSGKVTVTMVIRDDPTVVGDERHGRVRTRVVVNQIGARTVAPGPAELSADTAQWSVLLPGQRVRALVRVRPPPAGSLLTARLTAAGPPTLIGHPPIHQRLAGAVRDRLQIVSSRALGSESSGLLPGLVIGDTRTLDPVVQEDFRASGLSHLTAVSGSNFAIICGAVLMLVRAAGASPRLAAILGAVTILGFVVLVRPSPSVLRAAIMGAIGLLALLSSRRAQAFPALGAAVVGALLWWPELALQPGFALSVVATAGLVLWAPRIRDGLRGMRIPPGPAEILAMAIAAQVVTAPIVAMVTGTFSVVGVVANLLVAPVVAVISVVGTVAACVGVIGSADGAGAATAELLVRGVAPELWWMRVCARTLGRLSWARIVVPDGVLGAAIVLVVTGLVVLVRRGCARWMSRGRRSSG